MFLSLTYVDIIGMNYPNVQVHSLGDGSLYEHLVHAGGDPIPDQATLDLAKTEYYKNHGWKHIQAERDRRKAGGVQLASNGKWFHSDDTSRIQQLGLVLMGNSLPAINWKAMDGSFITMTPAIATEIFQTTAAKDIQIFSAAETHKAQLYASSTPETYNCLTASPGWPVIFGE